MDLPFQAEYRQRTPQSAQAWASAKQFIPGGFSQGSRFFAPYPFYAVRGRGSRIQDVDGNWYTDHWLAASANLLGHAHPVLLQAMQAQMAEGSHFGIPNPQEVEASLLGKRDCAHL